MGVTLDQNNPLLVVRNSATPIRVTSGFQQTANGTLQFALQNNWGSTISFDQGIPVALNGTLKLSAAPGVDPASLVGTDFHLFNWAGVTPTGQFTLVNDLPLGLVWTTSNLYTGGNVVLSGKPQAITVTDSKGPTVVGGVGGTFSEAQSGTLSATFLTPQTPAEQQQALQEVAAGAVNFVLPGGNLQLWDVSYTGAHFGEVDLLLHYDPSLIGDTPESELAVLHFENGSWVLPAGEQVDTIDHTILVPTESFSPFVLSVPVPEPSTLILLGIAALGLLGYARRLLHA